MRRTVPVVGLGILIFVTACANIGVSPKPPIKIGIVTSMTGPAANTGLQELDAAQLAVELVNAAGGINGQMVEAVTCDDKYDAATAAVCMTKFVNDDKVVAVGGPMASAPELSIIPVAERLKVPNVAFAALTGDYIDNPPAWSFGMYPAAPIEARAILNYIASNIVGKKIGIILDSTPYSTSLRDLFVPLAKDAGFNVVAMEQYQPTDTDFRPQLTKIQSANPDVLVQFGGSIPPAIISKQKYDMGINVPMVAGSPVFGVGLDKFIEIAGTPATNGLVASLSTLDVYQTLSSSDPRTPVVQQFAAAFKKKYNREPVNYNGIAFDAMNLIFDAIRKVGTDPVKVRDALEQTQGFVGTTAIVGFNPKNHIGPTPESLVMTAVKDGKLVPVAK